MDAFKLPNELSPFEKRFISKYISNGFNGTRAYMACRPKVAVNTASVNASKLLASTKIKDVLQSIEDKEYVASLATRENLINEAHEIGIEARSKEEYGAALKANELKGKYTGAFESRGDPMDGYTTILQQLNVTVNQGEPRKDNDTGNIPEVIDVKPVTTLVKTGDD